MKERSLTHGIGVELVAIGQISVTKAQTRVAACQSCSPSVSRTFGSVLVEVLGATDLSTDYVLSVPALCPNCFQPIFENTLVRCEGERAEESQIAIEPRWEDANVVLIDGHHLADAEAFIIGCEHCSAAAEITFDYILDEVTGHDPTITEYVLCRTAKCPRCDAEVTEKTLVVIQ